MLLLIFCGSGGSVPCDGSVTPADALGILKAFLLYPDPCRTKAE